MTERKKSGRYCNGDISGKANQKKGRTQIYCIDKKLLPRIKEVIYTYRLLFLTVVTFSV